MTNAKIVCFVCELTSNASSRPSSPRPCFASIAAEIAAVSTCKMKYESSVAKHTKLPVSFQNTFLQKTQPKKSLAKCSTKNVNNQTNNEKGNGCLTLVELQFAESSPTIPNRRTIGQPMFSHRVNIHRRCLQLRSRV